MNPLAQTDLQAYLRRLVKEHLPPKRTFGKTSAQESTTALKQTNNSNVSEQCNGDIIPDGHTDFDSR